MRRRESPQPTSQILRVRLHDGTEVLVGSTANEHRVLRGVGSFWDHIDEVITTLQDCHHGFTSSLSVTFFSPLATTGNVRDVAFHRANQLFDDDEQRRRGRRERCDDDTMKRQKVHDVFY